MPEEANFQSEKEPKQQSLVQIAAHVLTSFQSKKGPKQQVNEEAAPKRQLAEGLRTEQNQPSAEPFEAYIGPLPYAFVSYAHKDSDAVFPGISRLHAQGYRIWYDEGIDPGNEWPEEIGRYLAGCSFFIVFVSPNAVQSHNVRNEINFALKKRKPFLAIHIVETTMPDGLELQMGAIEAILKYRMSEESYCRKLAKKLPGALIST
jgi:hypothetical protein